MFSLPRHAIINVINITIVEMCNIAIPLILNIECARHKLQPLYSGDHFMHVYLLWINVCFQVGIFLVFVLFTFTFLRSFYISPLLSILSRELVGLKHSDSEWEGGPPAPAPPPPPPPRTSRVMGGRYQTLTTMAQLVIVRSR